MITGARQVVKTLYFDQRDLCGGCLLIACTLIAIAWATHDAQSYATFWHYPVIAGFDRVHFINDVLMALFFFSIGLEVGSELKHGTLSSRKAVTLPLLSATGGYALPALIYLLIVGVHSINAKGWAIPTATDICFALSLLAMLGKRVPVSLRVFLLAIAVIDDIYAIVTVALFYTNTIHIGYLCLSVAIVSLMYLWARQWVWSPYPYLVFGCFLWGAMLLSGIHPTLAGVITALFVQFRSIGLSHRYEEAVSSLVLFLVVPTFALANAGVSLSGFIAGTVNLDITAMAVAVSLLVGKPLGIFGTVWVAVKLKLCELPDSTNLGMVFGVSVLCSLGFTLSLFIGRLAGLGSEGYKIGIVVAAIVASFVGMGILRITCKQENLSE